MRHFIACADLLGLSLTAFGKDIRFPPLKDWNVFSPFSGDAAQQEAAASLWLLK